MAPLDLALFHWLNADLHTAPIVVTAARWVSNGEAAALLLTSLGMLRQPRDRYQVLFVSVLALLIAWCAVRGLRANFPLPRPAQLGLGFQWVAQGARPGFPSMHVATACALATSLRLAHVRTIAALAWLCALAVAWSRICLGLHFPSDVGAGMLTGVASAAIAAALWSPALRWRGRFSAYWSHRVLPWAPHR